MRNLMMISIGFALCLLSSGESAAEQTLAGDALKNKLSGQIAIGPRDRGDTMKINFLADGSAKITLTGDKQKTDKGKWWVQGEKLCRQFNRLFKGRKICSQVTADGDTLKWRKGDGSVFWTAKLVAPKGKSAKGGSTKGGTKTGLTGAQIKTLVADNRADGWSLGSGATTTIDFAADGSTHGFVDGSGGFDTGKWWVDGDKLCMEWDKWLKAQTSCYGVHVIKGRSILFKSKGKKGPRLELRDVGERLGP